MTAFTLAFPDGTRLAIDGAIVTLASPFDPPRTLELASIDVAMVVFEANAQAREARGLVARADGGDALPGTLADLGHDDDRTSITIRDGALAAAHVYDADPVGYADGLRPEVRDAAPLGDFDPATSPCEVLGVHAIRRLAAHPATRRCPHVAIEASEPYLGAVLDRAIALGLDACVTHLWMSALWNVFRGEPAAPPRRIGDQFPALRVLGVPRWAWFRVGEAPLPALERLMLMSGPSWTNGRTPYPPEPALAAVLDAIADRAPRLHALAFRHLRWGADELAALVAHPLIARLTALELFNVHHAFDHAALLALRPQLAHVTRIVVGKHLVAPDVVAAYAAWPAVTLASYDRRELIDLDAAWGMRRDDR